MKVRLIQYTANARELLIFSKRTRHMTSESEFNDVVDMTEEEKQAEMRYVFSTIGSSWEFVHYTFYITDVTRAFTHQLVRHRVGIAFAQQAQRVGTQENFGYMTPSEFIEGDPLTDAYHDTMAGIQEGYHILLEKGARAQDARGVLPTNIHTNILVKVNLRTLSDMFTVRLCLRAQGEFQNVAREMQKLVIGIHPWTSPVLAPNCLRYGVCKFPRYKDCPISQQFTDLVGMDEAQADMIRKRWEEVAGYDPQPTGTYADYHMGSHNTGKMKLDVLGLDAAEVLRGLLSLVMNDPPDVKTVFEWDKATFDEVAAWAAAMHLDASDNIVIVPPMPQALFVLGGKEKGK